MINAIDWASINFKYVIAIFQSSLFSWEARLDIVSHVLAFILQSLEIESIGCCRIGFFQVACAWN